MAGRRWKGINVDFKKTATDAWSKFNRMIIKSSRRSL
jgi:hypothetical protein